MEQDPIIPFDILDNALLDSEWHQVKCVSKHLYKKYLIRRESKYAYLRERLIRPLGFLDRCVILRLFSFSKVSDKVSVLISRSEALDPSKGPVYETFPKCFNLKVLGVEIYYSVTITLNGISWNFGSPTEWELDDTQSLIETLKGILG